MTIESPVLPCDIRYSQFASFLAAGLNQRQAYTKVYGACETDNATDHAASVLVRHSKVQAELARLKEASYAPALASIEERRQILARIARTKIDESNITPAHVLQAIEINNKMDKLYQDTKNEVNFGSIKILLVEGNGIPLENAPTISREAIETSGEYQTTTPPLSCPSNDIPKEGQDATK